MSEEEPIQVISPPTESSSFTPSIQPPEIAPSKNVSTSNRPKTTPNQSSTETSSTQPINGKKASQDLRDTIRHYIRYERDTEQKKWQALTENLNSEDSRRNEFNRRRQENAIRQLPVNILKFIGSLKRSVRLTMRHKGGTPYSIIRSMFIYWDADKSGLIDSKELLACMKSLGVKITLNECQEVVTFYSQYTDPRLLQDRSIQKNRQSDGSIVNSTSSKPIEMDYAELLRDIQRGEPSIIAFVSTADEIMADSKEIRFEEVGDQFVRIPIVVRRFLEAVREYLNTTMRTSGGTPYQHIRHLFQFYDYDYSGGLDAHELVLAVRRKMKYRITDEQAKAIVAFYDRKGVGQINYEQFLADVCADVRPVLAFHEPTPEEVIAKRKSLAQNPFIPTDFLSPPSLVLENFKQRVKVTLEKKINRLGGSLTSWLREAFITWDRHYSGKISSPEHLVGVAKRLGVTLSLTDAAAIIRCYDKNDTGELHYSFLIQQLSNEDPQFLMNARTTDSVVAPETRMTEGVKRLLKDIEACVRIFVRKSGSRLNPRDVLHGTFLRFDCDSTFPGRVSKNGLLSTLQELRVKATQERIDQVMQWFDANGCNEMDYISLCNHLYGPEPTLEATSLPRIREAPQALKYTGTVKAGLSHRPATSESSARGGVASFDSTSTSEVALLLSSKLSGVENENRFSTTTATANVFGENVEFGVNKSTLERNLEPIQSRNLKLSKQKQRKNAILAERARVEKKLHEVEEQRKSLIDTYRTKKGVAPLPTTTN